MADKPPVPVKSDQLKNLPRGRQRPPPKPIPYLVHKSQKQGVGAVSVSPAPPNLLPEPGKKPEPPPRKISLEGMLPGQLQRGPNLPEKPKSSVRTNDSSSENYPSDAQKGPKFRRPRLNTPLSPPDPSLVANGLKTPPPVHPLRRGAAAPGSVVVAMNGKGNDLGQKVPSGANKDLDQLNHKGKVVEEAEVGEEGNVYSTIEDKPRRVISPPVPPSKPPLLPRPPRTSTPPTQRSKVVSRAVKTKGTKKEVVPPKPTSIDSYSVLSRPDRPSSNSPTAPGLRPGSPLPLYSSLEGQDNSGSSSPPIVPPRRANDPHQSHDCLEFGGHGASTPSEGYSVTVHSTEAKILKGHVPPKPTPAEEYSLLSRPDHPKKESSSSCVQNRNVPGVYSSLEAVEGSGGLLVPPRREESNSTSTQGYDHLEFGGLSEADMDVVREHYWMEDGESAGKGGASAGMDLYEVVGDPVNNDSESKSDCGALHKALCETKSAPVDGNQQKSAQPQVVNWHTDTSQKAKRSQASRDRYSLQISRDRSVFAAYQDESVVDTEGKVSGESSPPKLPPSPNRQKKPRLLGNQKKDENPQGIKPVDRKAAAEEDFYTIPPDAEISEHNPGHGSASAEAGSLLPVSLGTLEQADYETWRSVSSVEDDTAVDGRGSRSSLMTECVVELRNLHSTSPHTLVSIDQLTADKEKRESEKGTVIGTAKGKVAEEKLSTIPSNQPANRCESYDFEGLSCTGTAPDSREKHSTRDREAVGETTSSKPTDDDLSQYDLQTVSHPPIVTNVLGYCEIDVQGQASQVCKRRAEVRAASLEEAALMEDLSSYDLQTVSHAPVAMSFQGYSYCGVGPWNQARCKPGNAGAEDSASNTTTTTPAIPVGYTEIDIMSPTRSQPPQAFSPSARPPSKHPSAERPLCEASQPENSSDRPAPKPRKKINNSRDDSVSVSGILSASSTDDGGAQAERAQSLPIPGGQNQHDLGSRDLHTPEDNFSDDDDGLYARVVDIKARKRKKSGTASPKPSPQVDQKENITKPLPKVTKKPRAPPRRQPPPPPPGVSPATGGLSHAAHTPGTPSSPPKNSGVGKRALVAASAPGEMELSLPPLPTKPRPGRSAATSATSDFTTSYYSPSEKHKVLPPSPKQFQKGFSTHPSHPMQQGSSQQQQQQQAQWKSIFSRGKSWSLRNKPDAGAAVSPLSPLAGDRDVELEKADKKSEQSPKLKWRDKFRLRRTSSNGTSNTEEADGLEKNERKRRNQEEKLPELPGKTKSLPASARLDNALKGVHIHNGLEEEEEEEEEEEAEEEDDLGGIYSVVGIGAQSPKTTKVQLE